MAYLLHQPHTICSKNTFFFVFFLLDRNILQIVTKQLNWKNENEIFDWICENFVEVVNWWYYFMSSMFYVIWTNFSYSNGEIYFDWSKKISFELFGSTEFWMNKIPFSGHVIKFYLNIGDSFFSKGSLDFFPENSTAFLSFFLSFFEQD